MEWDRNWNQNVRVGKTLHIVTSMHLQVTIVLVLVLLHIYALTIIAMTLEVSQLNQPYPVKSFRTLYFRPLWIFLRYSRQSVRV